MHIFYTLYCLFSNICLKFITLRMLHVIICKKFYSNSRYLILQLILAIALPDSATYHFKPKKRFVDVCATKQFEDCEKWLFWFLFISGGKTTRHSSIFSSVLKGKNIFFNISWKMTAKRQDTRMGLQSG